MERVIGELGSKILTINEKTALNLHCFAAGKSGCGKTTNLLGQIVSASGQGEFCVVLNWRNCIRHELLEPTLREAYAKVATVIDVARNGLALPLFSPLVTAFGEEEEEKNMIRRVTSLLKVAANLSPTQERMVYEAVKTVAEQGLYQTEGIRAINEFLKLQDRAVAHNAAAKMACICDNNIFYHGEFLKEPGRVYELDLNGLEYDDQLVVMRFLLDYLLRLAEKGCFIGTGLTILVDECQNFEFSDGSTLRTMINETRKLGVRLLLAAPSILNKKGMEVVHQCGAELYFAPMTNERRQTAEQIDPRCVEEWIFLLSRLQRGEFVACLNGNTTCQPMKLCTWLPSLEESKKERGGEGNVCH